MEARIRERVELSNFGVVASIKDEATRAATSLRDSSRNNQEIVAEGRQIVDLMRKSRAHGDLLLSDLREIKAELKANRESNQKTAEATENSKNSILKIKEIVLRVNHVFAISWISIGVCIGFVLCIIATQVSGWLAVSLLALAIGLLQAIARNAWKFVQEMAEGLRRLI